MRDNLLTTQQVAERTGYAARHVRLLIRQGHLHALRHGPMWFIAEEDLKQFQETYTPEHQGWPRGWKRTDPTTVPENIAALVREARELCAAGETQRDVARALGKSEQWVQRVVRKKTWAKVE